MGRLLRSIVVWTFTTTYWSALIAVHLLCLKRLPPRWVAAAAQFWGRVTLRLLGIRLEILNESTIATQQARVIIVNHQSAVDMAWGAAICPPAPLGIGKREIIYVPVFNLIWWGMGFIRINRSNHAAAIRALEGVASLITSGRRSLIVAPEGTRTPDGTIGPFKKGAFHIARQAQVPICPVVVSGAFETLPKGSVLPGKGHIRLRFLPPVPTQGLTRENEDAFIENIRQDMIRAYEELQPKGQALKP
jgi:1-acyl-sn-glycerol-3-phosphate acyltransferase